MRLDQSCFYYVTLSATGYEISISALSSLLWIKLMNKLVFCLVLLVVVVEIESDPVLFVTAAPTITLPGNAGRGRGCFSPLG